MQPAGRSVNRPVGDRSNADGEFDAFVRDHAAALFRLARALTGSDADAHDLVQSALLKVWRAWARIAGNPTPSARTVLVRTFVSGRRRRWWREHPTADLPEPRLDRTDSGDRTAADLDLAAAVAALPAAQRAVIVLRFYADYSVADTGRILGVREGTVTTQTHRALAMLRIRHDDQSDDVRRPPAEIATRRDR